MTTAKRSTVSTRLNDKSVDDRFVHLVEEGYRCPPFVSHALLQTAKNVYGLDQPQSNPSPVGKVTLLAVPSGTSANVALKDADLRPIQLTLDAGPEDEEIRATHGLQALRRQRILRLSVEALDQGCVLSQEDLGYKLLNCDVRTIRRDIRDLRKQGLSVPTRGQHDDIGPGLTHRAKAVELFLQRKTALEVAQQLRHSLVSIERYLDHFARVAYLTRRGERVEEISFLVRISPRLVREHQRLLETYATTSEDRIRELVASGDPGRTTSSKKTRWEP